MLPLILRGAISDISGYGSLCRYMARAMYEAGLRPAIFDMRCDLFSYYVPSSDEERAVLDELRSLKMPDPSESLVLDAAPPQLFNHCFKADVGYTMIECTQIQEQWAASCKLMDAVFVPGPFSVAAFEKSGASNITEVAPGFDTGIYRWVPEDRFGVWSDLKPEPFKFLVTGHLMHSVQDRKGIKQLVRCWAREFADDPDVGLALKTQVLSHDVVDRIELQEILWGILEKEGLHKMIDRVSVLHRNYTNAELATIYSHPSIKAFVSPTAGEGLGYNMLECASCGGVPVIATNFSEHVNFIPPELFIGLPFTLVPISEEFYTAPLAPYPKEAMWASVKDEDLMAAMRKFRSSGHYRPASPDSREIMPDLSLAAFGSRLAHELEWVVPGSRGRRDSGKVQIGSGKDPVDGWLHAEGDPMRSRNVDIACDPKRIPILDASLDEAAIYGVIDEMDYQEAARTAYECYRMLVPGGVVRMIFADAETIMRTILEEEDRLSPHAFEFLRGLLNGSKNLWTRKRALKLLRRCGFSDGTVDRGDFPERPIDDAAEELVWKGFRISTGVRAVKPA